MFKDKIKQTEKNIIKTIKKGQTPQHIEELVDMYREASRVAYQTEEIKDKVYPEIKKQFDEVFSEQDKLVTRVLQIGGLIASISKDSERTTERIDVDKIVADLKIALPQYAELIQQTLDATLQLTRVQVSPSLYVLNKKTSDKERLRQFTESKLAAFIETPTYETLLESTSDMAKLHESLKEDISSIFAKIKPFMNKMYRIVRGASEKGNDVFKQYVEPHLQQEAVIVEQEVEQELVEDEETNPYVLQIKRLAKKATATLDENDDYVVELAEALESYVDIGDIISRSNDLKKTISNDLKEEMAELFSAEERAFNNVVDLGEHIVVFTSEASSRVAGDKALAAEFIKNLTKALPTHVALVEDIYEANKVSSTAATKSSIKIKKEMPLEESIDTLRNIYTKFQAFASKIARALIGRIKETEVINDTLAKINTKILSESQAIVEAEEIEDENKYVCVYQPKVAIFGVGATESDAFAQAENWVDTDDKEWKSKFKVAKCNSDVVDYYNLNGTPDDFYVADGILSLGKELSESRKWGSFALPDHYDFEIKDLVKSFKTKKFVKDNKDAIEKYAGEYLTTGADVKAIGDKIAQAAYGANIGKQVSDKLTDADYEKIANNIKSIYR